MQGRNKFPPWGYVAGGEEIQAFELRVHIPSGVFKEGGWAEADVYTARPAREFSDRGNIVRDAEWRAGGNTRKTEPATDASKGRR